MNGKILSIALKETALNTLHAFIQGEKNPVESLYLDNRHLLSLECVWRLQEISLSCQVRSLMLMFNGPQNVEAKKALTTNAPDERSLQ